MKRLTLILSAVPRPFEGDEEEEPVEEGKGDGKDDDDDDGVDGEADGEADGSAVVMAMKETFVDDDDAIIIGPEAVPDTLTVDGPPSLRRNSVI